MPSAQQKPVILVVEDEALVRLPLVLSLEDSGFSVIEAPTADTALELLFAGKPVDLVISDIFMPGTSGQRFADRVRVAWPGLPVILTSGMPPELDDRAHPVRADVAYLSKPFRLDVLEDLIRTLLLRGA